MQIAINMAESTTNLVCFLVICMHAVWAQNPDVCQPNPCREDGLCIHFPEKNEFVCVCPLGFLGKTCDTEIDECDSSPCQNGGTCEDRNNGFECICASGFRGKTCSEETNLAVVCHHLTCGPQGICLPLGGSFFCICPKGFGGTTCDESLNEDTTTAHHVMTANMTMSPATDPSPASFSFSSTKISRPQTNGISVSTGSLASKNIASFETISPPLTSTIKWLSSLTSRNVPDSQTVETTSTELRLPKTLSSTSFTSTSKEIGISPMITTAQSRSSFSTNPTQTSSTLSFMKEIEILILQGNIGDSTILKWYYDDNDNNRTGCLLFFKLEVKVPQEDGWLFHSSIPATQRFVEIEDIEKRNINLIRIVAVISLAACGHT
ncbi:Sushi, nidogen and EGF-like domain-containing protein 1 [Holothuria leucospilota]|uniref:Sushi, nidogen and EGF-like domain-containing protein 1 n=1 Tax=Holothuria leucospilota TaxID=206669 RepID=A0A9Q1C7W3_HOLLE|nr:Sushi, nidogen and EGF-like domain-containing protein 1 [Holothuria leucospilota]